MEIEYNNSHLIGSLEEFGLSKYEARAYLTIIDKGSLAASEIAYYANLPRTKVYPTLKKLGKKRLSVTSQHKPLICSAVPPQEAFGEIVSLHERRLKNMKKIVEKLQKISDEGQRPKGSEEKRYFILDPNKALEKIKNLIENSRSSINAILDSWGIRLFSQCKSSLIKAITNGVKIRVLLGNQYIGNEGLLSLPEDVDLKIGDTASNIVFIDSNNMIVIDSNNGKAAVFTSIDIFGLLQMKSFEGKWNNAIKIKNLIDIDSSVTSKAIQLTNIMENGLLFQIFEQSINNYTDYAIILFKIIEKAGIKMVDINSSEFFHIVDSALRIGYSGSLKHDKNNNIVSIQSKIDNKSILPWAFLLTSYFTYIGNDPKIMQNSKQLSNTQAIHIKLSKPIP